MRAQLIPADGGPSIDLVKDLSIVGRKEGCDIRVDHKSISKQHCVLVKSDGSVLLRDLGSTNGTRVNGQRVRRASLLPNDQVSFASIRFKIHFGPGEPPPARGDFTIQMGAEDVAALQSMTARKTDSSGELAVEPVKANELPDVCTDEPKPPDR